MRGRKPKTERQLLLDKTVAADAREIDVPPAPVWLPSDAKEEWERVAPDLASRYLLTPVDLMTLASYCDVYARWRSCTLRVGYNQEFYKDAKGNLRINPLMKLTMELQAEMRRIACEFGFTPVSRVRVPDSAPPSRENDDFNDFAMDSQQK